MLPCYLYSLIVLRKESNTIKVLQILSVFLYDNIFTVSAAHAQCHKIILICNLIGKLHLIFWKYFHFNFEILHLKRMNI